MFVFAVLTALVASPGASVVGLASLNGPDLPIAGSTGPTELLRGPVKSVVTESARFGKSEGRWVEGGRIVVKRASFAQNGEMTSQSQYLADGQLASKVTYKLDDDGHPVEKLTYVAEGAGPIGRETYAYSGGKMAEAVRYGRFENVQERFSFKYDDNGKLAEQDAYLTEGETTFKTMLVYDANGSLISQIEYGRNGEADSKLVFAYDAQGRKIVEKLYRPLRNHVYTKQFSYDAKGDLAKEVTYAGDGRLTARHTYRYTYDDRGNWTRRATYDTRSFKPVWLDVSYRTITYYGE